MIAICVQWTCILALSFSCAVRAQESAEPVSPAAFAKLKSFVDAKISPDGQRMAYLSPVDGRRSLFVHTFANDDVMRIAPGESLDYGWLRWASDDVIVISMSYSTMRQLTLTTETRLMAFDLTGDEFVRLVRPATIKGNANSRIVRSELAPPQIQDNVIDWLPNDPDHILVSLDEDHDARGEVRRINVRTGDYKMARGSLRGIQNWMTDASGNIRFGHGFHNSEYVAMLRDSEGDWTLISKASWYEDGWSPASFTTDPTNIYVLGPGEHGTNELRVLNINDGTFVETLFSNETYDVDRIEYHPVTGRPAGVSFVSHRREYHYFDETLNKYQKFIDKRMPGASNRITSTSRDMRKFLIESSSETEPGVLYLLDLDAKSLDLIATQNEFIFPDRLRPVEAVNYQSSDGLRIPAYLTLPEDSIGRKLPSIILPHGGPNARDDQSYSFISQFLASRGYAVLQPNFRGSEGYGDDFKQAGFSQWGGLMQDDLADGVAWLVKEGITDKNRICIVGSSYGGYAAAMGLAKTPNLYQCGVSINGVYNLPMLISDDKKYVGGSVWTRHIGLEGESARRVSPHHLVDQIERPLLIIHAKDDGRVPIKQAKSMYKRLRKRSSESRFVELPQGGHSLVHESARLAVLENLESFLEANIGAN